MFFFLLCKNQYVENKAANRFEEKVKDSINQSEPLICFGCYLPGINFANLLEGKSFAQPVYFNKATFSKEASFIKASFYEGASFDGAKFLNEAYFIKNEFTGKTIFRHAIFEQPNKVTFGHSDLSNVSFADTDIPRIRFVDKIVWAKERTDLR